MGLLGLNNDGKRIYQMKDGEVTREEFEYCAAMECILFDPEIGYAATLGPTWNMTLDPRFAAIENTFIEERRSVFGGDARQGIQTQMADGTFVSGVTELEQYSTILGEGRYFRGALLSLAYEKAIKALFPDKKLPTITHAPQYSGTQREYREGLTHFKMLLPSEQMEVLAYVDANLAHLSPRDFYRQEDGLLWQLIHEHSPNWFSRSGEANKEAQRLYRLFRADLVGLVDTYAEIAKYDEWVTLDGSGDLADVNATDREVNPMVYGEVDMIEKALTFRAQLRSTTARILDLLGVSTFLTQNNMQLTELERDQLVRLVFKDQVGVNEKGERVFKTTWPDGRTEISTRVLNYLTSIKVMGFPFEQRERYQLVQKASESQTIIADLKAGRVNFINRYTEPQIEIEQTPEEKLMEAILTDPLMQDLFLRYSQAEREGDTEVAALLAPLFSPEAPVVDEEAHLALVAEITALRRARAKSLGLEAPSPLSHLGEDMQAPVTDAPADHPLAQVLAAAPKGPEVIDVPDFTSDEEEKAWWETHGDFAPRVLGRDENGNPLFGEKKTAIRIAFNTPEPTELTSEQRKELAAKNHGAPRLYSAVSRATDEELEALKTQGGE